MSKASALESVVQGLDISPSDFQKASDRYLAVGNWLNEGNYSSGNTVDVYLQGSFRLGTVVRPFANGRDADYDIDQVCEISGGNVGVGPHQLKHDIGDRLKANGTYAHMLDAEGRRCWTLQYASPDGSPGFHLDVLPSRPSSSVGSQIHITHKHEDTYHWQSSNPRGYYEWFKGKNAFSPEALGAQMRTIFESNRTLYASVDDVPTQLARTQLQRAIQVMKRHRDVRFSGRSGAPISIILTTICAHQYQGGDVIQTLRVFVDYVARRLAVVVGGGALVADGALNYDQGKWVVPNPADGNENFADRWKDDPALAQNFFAWVYQLGRDLSAFDDSGYPPDMGLATAGPLARTVSHAELRLGELRANAKIGSSQEFLDLIHLGIEGQVPWGDISPIAERNVSAEPEGDGRDVALINYYQVVIHSGGHLGEGDKTAIRRILDRHPGESRFNLCCNLLLGTATAQMLSSAVGGLDGADVLRWPITRLAAQQIPVNTRAIVPAPRTPFYEHRA